MEVGHINICIVIPDFALHFSKLIHEICSPMDFAFAVEEDGGTPSSELFQSIC